MEKKWGVLVNVLALVLVLFVLGYIIFNSSFEDKDSLEECVDVNNVASFIYDVCYDAYSENLFIQVKRTYDIYQLRALEFSFFDYSENHYLIDDIPFVNSSKAYKIPADKNPLEVEVSLNVVKDFSEPICEGPRKLFVRYCPSGISQEEVNVSVSPLQDVEMDDFIELGRSLSRPDSDVLSLSLVDKERIWKSKCESSWSCTPFEECIDGIQKRTCDDLKNCFIPTDAPITQRYCDGGCVEAWECEWSECKEGFTVPKCVDKNKCGTSYDIPQKLECNYKKDCIPNIVCDEWSDCNVEYEFLNLVNQNIQEMKGTKSRTCSDLNSCVSPLVESRECSVSVDIYTKRFVKCGSEFIGLYNRLDNSLIARIENGNENEFFLNIHFDGREESPYCDYCFDGVKNGDEVGVDCGGSCPKCEDKYANVDFKKKSIWSGFTDWLKRLIT